MAAPSASDWALDAEPFLGARPPSPTAPRGPAFESLAWANVTVTVEGQRGGTTEPKELLRQVSGWVGAGQFVAVIGASGCGKTTLLNVVAGRRTPSAGSVFYNGVPLPSVASLSQRLAYVMQQDVHLANLTCREALTYAALLRLRHCTPRQKLLRVEALLAQLGLAKCADVRIGAAEGGGLSGGERKRLSIAMELVQGAGLLLLDEPTSGLDSVTAEAVVRALATLVAEGTAVLSTVHQPSSDMFLLFQHLIVMGPACIVYQGPAAEAVDYFAGFGYQCPQYCNPADYILRVLRGPLGGAAAGEVVVDLAAAHARQLAIPPAFTRGGTLFDDEPLTYAAGPWLQFRVLLWRAFTNVRRDPFLMYARLGQTLFLSCLAGAIFWRLPYTYHGITSKAGALFFLLFNQAIAPLMGVIHAFPTERALLFREQRSGMYRLSLYYLSKVAVELPVQMVFPCLFISILYYMCGFNPGLDRFFTLMGVTVMMAVIGQGLGLLASVSSESLAVILAVIPVFLMPFAILSGFVIQTIPPWLTWLERISFYRLALETALVNEFQGVQFPPCGPFDVLCPRSSEDVFRLLRVDASPRHLLLNWIMLVGYAVVLRILAFAVLAFKVHGRRD